MTTNTALPRNERGRVTGINACQLDLARLAEVIADALVEQGQTSINPADIEPYDSVLLLSQGGDKFALINDEGVGGYEHDGVITAWFSRKNSYLIESVDVPVLALESIDEHHDKVDLADFIRVFGDRLDSNHSIWANWYWNN
jgi:hypothetical protein